jgi:hypothetical protein
MPRTLYRAVTDAELHSVADAGGRFIASPHTPDIKGFFFEESSAVKFAARMNDITSEVHTVLKTDIDEIAIARGRVHEVAAEGPGVYLLESDWPLLSPAVQVSK